jgi:hypothetical protein
MRAFVQSEVGRFEERSLPDPSPAPERSSSASGAL